MASYAGHSSFSDPFIMYLSRYLIRFDAQSSSWYEQRLGELPSSWDASRRQEQQSQLVAGFGASLAHRLAPFSQDGAAGAGGLWSTLAAAYRHVPAAEAQLPLLFSFLAPADQPTQMMRAALASRGAASEGVSDGRLLAATAVPSSEDLRLLLLPPDALLPPTTFIEWDAAARGYRLPEAVATAAAASLGTVARAPVSREIALTQATYRGFALSGGFGCAITHLLVVPLDVVKTRLQTRPGRYVGFADALGTIREEEGLPMLFWGAGATGAGYFSYGVCVYPLYEFFKRTFFELAGASTVLEARVPLVLLAGATATFFTCFAITPFEAVRIRMVECPSYADSMLGAFRRFVDEGGFPCLYDGIIPLLIRQILFGMCKFLIFDYAADAILAQLPAGAGDDALVSLLVSLLSGAIAGVASAIVSQPADVVLSRVAQGEGSSLQVGKLPGSINQLALIRNAAVDIMNIAGMPGFFLGLPSRCLWSGAIIAGQFFLYDLFKQALHLTAVDLTLFYDAFGASAAFGTLTVGGS